MKVLFGRRAKGYRCADLFAALYAEVGRNILRSVTAPETTQGGRWRSYDRAKLGVNGCLNRFASRMGVNGYSIGSC